MAKIRDAWLHPQFATDVTKPMMIEGLLDQEVKFLSGGELQRVAMVLCLGTPADMYLVDEPSAYLDSEQRIVCAKVIKRFILHAKKTGFVVEHDFIMATYLADRVVVYDGQPGIECTANAPQTLLSGMNKFLRQLGVRPRCHSRLLRPMHPLLSCADACVPRRSPSAATPPTTGPASTSTSRSRTANRRRLASSSSWRTSRHRITG